ncbi:hypothetical protein T4D_7715 [Trichinella pseudospiralis]|uniref:Uncharacterized protein n=1 Tax=Trichinella pseudospiralis TaxID=6337 RepID=A0A0V1F278_TRIPS|nr:hypothetical protein T4D_7715 [Trichinella pseudospiralis]
MSHTEFVRVSVSLIKILWNRIEGFGKYRGILTGTHGINGF